MSDSTAPTLTAVSIASDNSTKTNYACHVDSDIVTLTITSDESINQPTVVFTSGGDAVTGSVTYGGSGTSWTAAYTVNSADTLGVVGYTINFSDTIGNAGVAVTATTDDSQVTIVGTKTGSITTTTTAGLQLGADIDGEYFSDLSGYSVSLSSDGTIVAIGAIYNDGPAGANNLAGHVRVYQRDESNTTVAPFGWTQLGDDIDGEAVDDQSGWSVSLSSDGTIVAIGTPYNDANGTSSGHVRVYQYREYTQSDDDNGTYHYTSREQGTTNNKPLIITEDTSTAPVVGNSYWTKLGDDIDGEIEYDHSGYSVSLSGDGTIVAIGAAYNDGTTGNLSDNRGHVRVYQRDESNTTVAPFGWTQIGDDIVGEAADDQSGRSVSLSSDGTIVAIGAKYNDDIDAGIYTAGHVRVYQYSNSTWTQLGSDIDGEKGGDESGMSVSLSSDGSIVAIGSVKNDGTTGNANDNRGHVRVYQYREYTQSDDDNGTYHYTSREQGNTNNKPLIITEDTSTAPVVGNSYWTKLGDDIDGENGGDESGMSVSLSSDGSIVAIGSVKNDGTTGSVSDNRGHVRVYQYREYTQSDDDNGTYHYTSREQGTTNNKPLIITEDTSTAPVVGNSYWTQLGDDIDGENDGDESGWSVSLSSDGATVAIGAQYNDGTDSNTGHVLVFETGATATTTALVAAIPPEISALTIISNNNNNTAYATQDNTVTISMIYDLSLSEAPTLDIQSGSADITNTATLTGADTTWSAAYIVDPSDTDGLVSFTIDASTNFAGMQSTSSEITNASTMTIDMTPPTFSSLYSSKNNNVRITFSEPVYNTNTGSGTLRSCRLCSNI